jgi:hypothetical protein
MDSIVGRPLIMMSRASKQVIRQCTLSNIYQQQLNIGQFYKLPKFTMVGQLYTYYMCQVLGQKVFTRSPG